MWRHFCLLPSFPLSLHSLLHSFVLTLSLRSGQAGLSRSRGRILMLKLIVCLSVCLSYVNVNWVTCCEVVVRLLLLCCCCYSRCFVSDSVLIFALCESFLFSSLAPSSVVCVYLWWTISANPPVHTSGRENTMWKYIHHNMRTLP